MNAYGPLPVNADAVVPDDIATALDAIQYKRVLVRRLLPRGANVIQKASEYAAGDVLLQKGQRITPERQAVLIAAGVRELKVSKRPRIGVVVSSYERCAPLGSRSCWQTPDACGPYIRTLIEQWGFEVAQIEYISPPSRAGSTPQALHEAEISYRRRMIELAQRYDLIIGSGMLSTESHRRVGLNGLSWFAASSSNDEINISQGPGSRFNLAVSRDRSPPRTEKFEVKDATGRVRESHSIHHFDRATFVNLPGFLSSVTVLMHVLVRRIIDLYEFVETPGPCWEIGELARDVECDRKTNLMQWAKIVWGPRGEPLIDPLPDQEPHRVSAFLDADVIAAIPVCRGGLAAGSRIHFLRLDPMRQPAAPNCAIPQPIEIITEAHHSTEFESMQPQMNIAQSWSCLNAWLQSMPDAIPGGFRAAASDDDIHVLEAAISAKLPADFTASLKTHNGQVDQDGVCFEGESLLNIKGILSEWTCWRDVIANDEFEGITSDPDGGVKDDWYNLKWIPITRNGMGDSLCLDLDPAPGGTFGQVIRVWHDDERRERVAASFEAWLCRMVMDITGLEEQKEQKEQE